MDFALGLGSPDPDLIGALFPARMHLRLNLRLKVCCLGSGQGRQENHAKVGHVPSIVDTCDQDFFCCGKDLPMRARKDPFQPWHKRRFCRLGFVTGQPLKRRMAPTRRGTAKSRLLPNADRNGLHRSIKEEHHGQSKIGRHRRRCGRDERRLPG